MSNGQLVLSPNPDQNLPSATPPLPLTSQQLEKYANDGYLVLKGVIDRETIRLLADRINSHLKIFDTRLKTSQLKYQNIPNAPIEFKKGEDQSAIFVLGKTPENYNERDYIIKRVNWLGALDEDGFIFKVSRHPEILGAVHGILNLGAPPGKETLLADHLICQLHPKDSGDGVSFAWHQDVKQRKSWDENWSDINNNGSFVQTLMAIDKITKDNGPILIAPFDQKKHGKDLNLPYEFNNSGLLQHFDPNNVTILEMDPGDVVFMSPYLIHGSYPNNSRGATRYLLVNGYAAPGANHRLYPGRGSCARVNLINGEVITDYLSQFQECKIELFASI